MFVRRKQLKRDLEDALAAAHHWEEQADAWQSSFARVTEAVTEAHTQAIESRRALVSVAEDRDQLRQIRDRVVAERNELRDEVGGLLNRLRCLEEIVREREAENGRLEKLAESRLAERTDAVEKWLDAEDEMGRLAAEIVDLVDERDAALDRAESDRFAPLIVQKMILAYEGVLREVRSERDEERDRAERSEERCANWQARTLAARDRAAKAEADLELVVAANEDLMAELGYAETIISDHHAAGALDDVLVGDPCPVCAPKNERSSNAEPSPQYADQPGDEWRPGMFRIGAGD